MIVVDASVAVKWFVKEPGHERALAVPQTRGQVAAPDRLLLEVSSVLHRKLKSGEMAVDQAEAAIGQLLVIVELIVPSSQLVAETFRFARVIDHSVYDCVYLAYADYLKAPLLTADERFAAKAHRMDLGVAIETI